MPVKRRLSEAAEDNALQDLHPMVKATLLQSKSPAVESGTHRKSGCNLCRPWLEGKRKLLTSLHRAGDM